MRTTADSCLRLRASPSRIAPETACLELGTPVVALESDGSWRRVRLADNREGWVAKAFLEFAPVAQQVERERAAEDLIAPPKPLNHLWAALLGAGVTAAVLVGAFLLIGRDRRGDHSYVPSGRHPGISGSDPPDPEHLLRPIETRLDALKTGTSEHASKLAEVAETAMKLQGALDERDQEIRRLKKGYDAEIFRRFLRRFIRIDQALADLTAEGSADPAGVDQARKMFEDALDECGVERFEPEIGADYRTALGIGDNPKVVRAPRPDDAFKIAEVVDPGYRLRGNSQEIVLPARVKIFLSSVE